MHGVSMIDTFTQPQVPSKRKTQYFEMLGQRAIWQDGWVAVTHHEIGIPFNEDNWELYDVNQDFSQKYDVAQKYPGILKELQELWWMEAKKYNVLPLDDRLYPKGYQGLQEGRTSFVFFPGMAHLPTSAAPRITLASYSITVPIFRLNRDEDGVLLAHGNFSSGYTLYIKNNYLIYEYNYIGTVYRIQSSVEVAVGYSTIRFEFTNKLLVQGTGRLYMNGQQVGEVFMPRTLPFIISVEGLDIGMDRLAPVSSNYPRPEFAFSGKIEKVVIEIQDELAKSNFSHHLDKDSIIINLNGNMLLF
jgi:hypothetical protein